MTLDEQQKVISRGRDAQSLSTNPVLEEAFKVTLDDLFAQWCSTSADEGTLRDGLWATAQALREFRGTLQTFISEGKIEEMNRDEDQRSKINNY